MTVAAEMVIHEPLPSSTITVVTEELVYRHDRMPQVRRPASLGQTTREEILDLIRGHLTVCVTRKSDVICAARCILDHLQRHPGATWADRWVSFEESLPPTHQSWALAMRPGGPRSSLQKLVAGFGALVRLELFRPSFAWVIREHLNETVPLMRRRDPEQWTSLVEAMTGLGFTPNYLQSARRSVGQVMLSTGARPSEITAEDLIEFNRVRSSMGVRTGHGLQAVWRAILQLGWFDHPSPSMPLPTRRHAPLTPAQIVDTYQIREPHRAVFIEYLKARQPALTYSSLRNLGRVLVGIFWSDVAAHHPEISNFQLSRDAAAAWKERMRARIPETTSHYGALFCVRAFYLDLAQWALEDSYWASWVAPSPVSKAEVQGYGRSRRRKIATIQQRTRELAPLLPRLVDQADRDLQRGQQMLRDAEAAGVGGEVVVDGLRWRVQQTSPASRLRLLRDGAVLVPAVEEDLAFWSWALLEGLRHSGVRIEELLEMTHMAIQRHRLPTTGEEVPLVHIPPSKTDAERLIVASPELVHALSQIVSRVRAGREAMPLTRRWDPCEKEVGPDLPHLYVRVWAGHLQVISMATVRALLDRLAERADLSVAGEPVRFTPHDFRRLFATDALASGLPPHIVQVLMGHKSISTTQGYAAIYPHDVIRHHRTFIDRRRTLRPSEEYREPTPEEWDQFEDHFVQRRVSLGSCGRAWGTSCQHEHACVRCGLLRRVGAQIERLRDIIRNLGVRIKEAEEHSWQGEVEGLRITLVAAEGKLTQMERAGGVAGPVPLGLPAIPTPGRR